MEHLQALIDPSKQFAKDSIRLVKRCTKPDRKGILFVMNAFLSFFGIFLTFLETYFEITFNLYSQGSCSCGCHNRLYALKGLYH